MTDSDVYLGGSLGISGPVNAMKGYPLGVNALEGYPLCDSGPLNAMEGYPLNAMEGYPLGASGPLGLSGDVDAPKFDVADRAIIAGIGSIILMKQLF